MSVNAACCRAMCIPAFKDLKDLTQEVLRIDLNPMLKGKILDGLGPHTDRIKTAQMLVELPEDWENWPEDAKLACPKKSWEASREIEGRKCLFATCKYLDRDLGSCMIYESRPAMCREYTLPTCVNRQGGCQFLHCSSRVNGECKPNL